MYLHTIHKLSQNDCSISDMCLKIPLERDERYYHDDCGCSASFNLMEETTIPYKGVHYRGKLMREVQ